MENKIMKIGKKEMNKHMKIMRKEIENKKKRIEVDMISVEYKVYVGEEEKDSILNLSSYNIINLPSNFSDGFSLSNLENSLNNTSGLSCGVLNQTIENIVSLLYKNLSVKSQSLVINILCSDLDSLANSPFEIPFGLKITSKSFLRNCNNSFLTFSSSRNLSFLSFEANDDIVTPLNENCSILQSCFNMLFCERYKECIKNFFCWDSSFEHLQDLPNHYSCTFECGLSMTDFTVCNNMFIDFDSHNKNNAREYLNLSDFSLKKITEVYDDINNNKELYFLNSENKPVKIKSITKEPYSGRIYDVDVGNDIILVERDGLVVWSGNSNNGSKQGNAVQTDTGFCRKGFGSKDLNFFDGVEK